MIDINAIDYNMSLRHFSLGFDGVMDLYISRLQQTTEVVALLNPDGRDAPSSGYGHKLLIHK
jgi:diaminopimelate epimerase